MRMIAPLEVGICCEDIERLIRFYTDLVGCERVSVIEVPAAAAEQASLSSSAYKVARVQTPRGERLKFLQPAQAPQESPSTRWILDRRNISYLTFIVDDLQAAIERLHSLGAELMSGPRPIRIREGVWLCFARDPEANIIEFVQYEEIASYVEKE